jgi:hypothetical protein
MKTKWLSIIVAGLIISSCTPAAVKTSPPVVISNTETAAMPAAVQTAVPTTAPSQATNTSEVSFSKDIWPVLEKFALKAHGGKGGVFLESYSDVIKYVIPGNPDQSELYQELAGKGMPQMPPNNPLPSKTIQLFYDWIKQGAKNN